MNAYYTLFMIVMLFVVAPIAYLVDRRALKRKRMEALVEEARTNPRSFPVYDDADPLADALRSIRAATLETCRLQRERHVLHSCLDELRAAGGGHGHFDPTGRSGSGCPLCDRWRLALDRVDTALRGLVGSSSATEAPVCSPTSPSSVNPSSVSGS